MNQVGVPPARNPHLVHLKRPSRPPPAANPAASPHPGDARRTGLAVAMPSGRGDHSPSHLLWNGSPRGTARGVAVMPMTPAVATVGVQTGVCRCGTRVRTSVTANVSRRCRNIPGAWYARRVARVPRVTLPDVLPVEQYVAGLARKRMAAGVLFRDRIGRVLLVEPSYKPNWEIPGGAEVRPAVEAAGCRSGYGRSRSPRDAHRGAEHDPGVRLGVIIRCSGTTCDHHVA